MRVKAIAMITIEDWCVTKDRNFRDGDGIYADHLANCTEAHNTPIMVGDCCWAHDDVVSEDGNAVCFYCGDVVPPEVQALVLLQMTL